MKNHTNKSNLQFFFAENCFFISNHAKNFNLKFAQKMSDND